MLGIDVSGHQPSISWAAVRDAGIQFGWVKATEGQTFVDGSHARHRKEARRAGVPLGAYHFARPDTDVSTRDPVAEADHFLEVAPPREGDLLPVLDLETPGLSPARMARWAKAWLRRVERAIGQPPILYTYPSFWTDQMGNSPAFGRYPLWLASYGKNDGRVHPVRKVGGWTSIAVHQYTSEGRIPGFSGPLDLNRLMRGWKLDQLRLGATTPPPAPRFGQPWRIVARDEVLHEGRRLDAGFLERARDEARGRGNVTIRGTRRD
ncbi:MAG TPA: glycoside hydrolase family 25 protein [Candidatus Limnocylindrales bacterium]|nr:glycoside hydrolase family 25 protein [Candidatus Limnocylindrales bacterium]